MDPIILVVILLLGQYPLCIFSLIQMFKLRFSRIKSIIWNVVILLLPFVGAGLFWLVFGKKLRVLVGESKGKDACKHPVSALESEEQKNIEEDKNVTEIKEKFISAQEKDKSEE